MARPRYDDVVKQLAQIKQANAEYRAQMEDTVLASRRLLDDLHDRHRHLVRTARELLNAMASDPAGDIPAKMLRLERAVYQREVS